MFLLLDLSLQNKCNWNLAKPWENQDQKCVSGCGGDECKFDSNKRCGRTWAYYMDGGTRRCVSIDGEDCKNSWPYYSQYSSKPYLCVSYCPTSYVDGLYCVNSCPNFIKDNRNCATVCDNNYAKPLTGQFCQTGCPYRLIDNLRYCITTLGSDKCTEEYQYYQTLNNPPECKEECQYYQADGKKICMDECQGQYPNKVISETPYECVTICPEIEKYVGENNICTPTCPQYFSGIDCTDSCSQEYAYPEQGFICDDQCQYHILNNSKYCDSICDDLYPYHGNIVRDICVNNCSQLSQLSFSQELECVQHCTDDYAKPQQGNICDNKCQYYTNDIKYCTVSCPENYKYQYSASRKQCVSDCSEIEQYQYNDESKSPYQCVQQCNGLWNYYVNNNCVEKCINEWAYPESGYICDNQCQYYNKLDNSKQCMSQCTGLYLYHANLERNQCVKNCSEMLSLSYQTELECTQGCTDNYALPETGNKCDDKCQYHQIDQQLYCDSICQEPYQYHAATERQQCVSNCSQVQQLPYSSELECTESCFNEYAIPELGNICDKTCQYHVGTIQQDNQQFIDSNTKYCDSSCDDDFSYHVLLPRNICVHNCSEIISLQYATEKECTQGCTHEYAYPIEGNQCSKECRFDIIQGYKKCVEFCELPNYLLVQGENIREHCVSACSGEDVMIYQEPGFISEDCTKDCGKCVNNCSTYQAINQTNNYCDIQCLFYSLQGIEYCTQKCQQPYIYEYSFNINLSEEEQIQRTQCIQACNETEKLFIQDNQCVDQCDFEHEYAYWLNNKTCDWQCNWILKDEQRICIQSCSTPYIYKNFYQNDEKKYQCVQDCNEVSMRSYSQEMICVSQCTKPFAKPLKDDDSVCDQTCTYKIVNNNYQCVVNCHSENMNQINDSRPYCVSECNEQKSYIIISEDEKICIQYCPNEYAKPMEGQYCDNTCQYYVDLESEVQQKVCIDKCKENNMFYITSQNKQQIQDDNQSDEENQEQIAQQQVRTQCTQSCTLMNYQYYYEDDTLNEDVCVNQCPETYSIPIQGQLKCDLTCKYYTYMEQDYCTEDCIQEYPNLYQNGTREQCLDICPEELKYSQDNQCVSECTIPYAYPYDGQLCSQTCLYENHAEEQKYLCVSECIEDYNLIIKGDRNQCVYECNEQYKYQQLNECLQICKNEYAVPQDENNLICDKQCQYQIIENVKYCIDECTETQFEVQNSYRKYCLDKCSEDSIYYYQNGQQCVYKCSNYWYQYDESTKICTNQTSCHEIKDYEDQYLQYLNLIDKQCLLKCDLYWYIFNENNYTCIQQDNCQNIKDNNKQLQPYLQPFNNQCVNQCSERKYIYEQNIYYCTQYDNCLDAQNINNISLLFYKQDANECIESCQFYQYKYSSNDNWCTQQSSCENIQNENQTQIPFKLTEQSLECITQCTLQVYEIINNENICIQRYKVQDKCQLPNQYIPNKLNNNTQCGDCLQTNITVVLSQNLYQCATQDEIQSNPELCQARQIGIYKNGTQGLICYNKLNYYDQCRMTQLIDSFNWCTDSCPNNYVEDNYQCQLNCTQEQYKIANNKCIESCEQQLYKFIEDEIDEQNINRAHCIETCEQYTLLVNNDKECNTDCQSMINYNDNIKFININTKQCLYHCNYYLQVEEQLQCQDIDDNQRNVESCPYYIYDQQMLNNKCLEQCEEGYYIDNYQCVTSCQTNQFYSQDQTQCLDSCLDEQFYSKQTINEQDVYQCQTSCESTETIEYYQGYDKLSQTNYRCEQQCSEFIEQNMLLLIDNSINYCVIQCQTEFMFIENNVCKQSCDEGNNVNSDSLYVGTKGYQCQQCDKTILNVEYNIQMCYSCDEGTIYKITFNENSEQLSECVEQSQCQSDDIVTYSQSDTIQQCVQGQNCSQFKDNQLNLFKNNKYQYQKQCVQQCNIDTFIYLDQNEIECVEQCDNNRYYQENEQSQKLCKDCQIYYDNENEQVCTDCINELEYLWNNSICSTTACVEGIEQQLFIFVNNNINECVESCIANNMNFYQQNTQLCTNDCNEVINYKLPTAYVLMNNNERQCVDKCQYNQIYKRDDVLSVDNDIYQCTEESQCDTNKFEYILSQEIVYVEEQEQQQTIKFLKCIEQCTSQQYYIEIVENENNKLICGNSCNEISLYQYYVKIDDDTPLHCIEQCEAQYQFIQQVNQEKQCLQYCKYTQLIEQIEQDQIQQFMCQDNECSQYYELYDVIIDEQTQQQSYICHDNCQQSQLYNKQNSYIDKQICTTSCKFYKYNISEENTQCVDDCILLTEQQLTSADYDNQICITYDQCSEQEYYYINYKFNNIEQCIQFQTISFCNQMSNYVEYNQYIKQSSVEYQCTIDCNEQDLYYINTLQVEDQSVDQYTCTITCPNNLLGLEITNNHCVEIEECKIQYYILMQNEDSQEQCVYNNSYTSCLNYSQSLESLTSYIYQQNDQCVQECPYDWSYNSLNSQEEYGNVCNQTCQYYYFIDDSNQDNDNTEIEETEETQDDSQDQEEQIVKKQRRICMDTCDEQYKYQILHEYKVNEQQMTQCVEQCPYSVETVQYQYQFQNNQVLQCVQHCYDQEDYTFVVQNNTCQDSCGQDEDNDKLWYYNNDKQEKYCTEYIKCSQFKDIDGKQYQYISHKQNGQCLQECDTINDKHLVWYKDDNNENQCVEQANCNDIQDKEQLDKMMSNYRCVKSCDYTYWYLVDDSVGTNDDNNSNDEEITQIKQNHKQCTTSYNCQDLESDNVYYYVDVNNQCIENCNQNQYWYQYNSDTRKCTLQYNCNDAVQYVDEQTQIQLLYLQVGENNKQCIQSCNDNFYYKQYVNSVFKCTDKQICQNVQEQIIIDSENIMIKQYLFVSDINKQQCIESCEQNVWYTTENEQYCSSVTLCSQLPEQQKLYDKLEKQNECVQQCTQQYWFIDQQQVKTCTSTQSCSGVKVNDIEYSSIDYDEDQCISEQYCKELGNEYKYIDKSYCIVYKSIEKCIQLSEQPYNLDYTRQSLIKNRCVISCQLEEYQELNDDQIVCVSKCGEKAFGIEISKRDCVSYEYCIQQQYYIIANTEINSCYYQLEMTGCEQYQSSVLFQKYVYQEETQCKQGCLIDYAYPVDVNSKICDNKCDYYENENGKFCVEKNKCTKEYNYQLQNEDRNICISTCPYDEQFIYIYQHSDPFQCLEHCNLQKYIYIQEQNCQEHCTNEYAQPITELTTDIVCNQFCKYYILNGIKYCTSTDNTLCNDEYQYQLDVNNRQCVQQCPYDQQYVYINEHENPIQCLDKCEGEYSYIQEDKCKEKCSNEFAKPLQQNVCDQNCQFIINDNLDKECIDQCNNEYIYHVILNNNRQQCVINCSQISYKQLNQEFECVQNCTNDYARPLQGNDCNNECMYHVTTNDDEKYCVQSCISSQYELQTQRKQCIEECPYDKQYTYINNNVEPQQCQDKCDGQYVYIEDINCQEECTDEYAEPIKGYICSTTCQFFINEDNNKECIIACKKDYKYHVLLESEREQCVYNCSETDDKQLSQLYECVEQCSDDYALPYEGNVCNNTCLYTLLEETNQKQCVKQCSKKQYEVQDVRSYCTDSCGDLDNYVFQQDKYCVEECSQNFWYQEKEQQICVDKCSDVYYQAYNLDTYECNTVTQCKENYHLISDQYGTTCQYSTNIQSCDDFASLRKDTNQCTYCNDQNYEVQNINNVNVCQEIQEEVKQQIPTMTILVIVAGVVIIVLVVLIIMIKFRQLKQRTQKQEIEMNTVQSKNNKKQEDIKLIETVNVEQNDSKLQKDQQKEDKHDNERKDQDQESKFESSQSYSDNTQSDNDYSQSSDQQSQTSQTESS